MIVLVLRTVFALILLAGVYLVAAVVVLFDLAILAAPIVAVLVLPVPNAFVYLAPLIILVTAPGVLAVVTGLLVIIRVREPWRSISLPAAGTGPLRDVLAGIARQAGTPAPAELRLTAMVNAAVTERFGWSGRRRGDRTLYIGLPVLVGMSVPEVAAVLSHEMGHYAGEHARAGRFVNRGLVSLALIRRSLRALYATAPARGQQRFRPAAVVARLSLLGYTAIGYAAFTAYQAVFELCFFAMRRGQEYDADQVAERIVGAADLAAALRRITVLSLAWADFHARFLAPMQLAGCAPDDAFTAFGAMLADREYQQVLRTRELAAGQRRTLLTDTHPALADRLARLTGSARQAGSAGFAEAVPGGQPATTLIPALPGQPWAAELSATLQPFGEVESLPWDECLRRIGQPPPARDTPRKAAQPRPEEQRSAANAAASAAERRRLARRTRRIRLAVAAALTLIAIVVAIAATAWRDNQIFSNVKPLPTMPTIGNVPTFP